MKNDKEIMLIMAFGMVMILVTLFAIDYKVKSNSAQIDELQQYMNNTVYEYKDVCINTCQAVATNQALDENGTAYNYTVPHTYLYTVTDKYDYCTCLFQGTGQTFTFDAALKAAYDEEIEVKNTSTKSFPSTPGYAKPIDAQYVVSCESNSMGLTISCNDHLSGYHVQEKSSLTLGRIYTYNTLEGESVVHRLAICLKAQNNTVVEDNGCQHQLVFKGDNNERGEIVNRSQVESLITVVEYR